MFCVQLRAIKACGVCEELFNSLLLLTSGFHNALGSIVLQFRSMKERERLKLGSALGGTHVCNLVIE
jgi:hypothetical protein